MFAKIKTLCREWNERRKFARFNRRVAREMKKAIKAQKSRHADWLAYMGVEDESQLSK
jgi:hypothetical protein